MEDDETPAAAASDLVVRDEPTANKMTLMQFSRHVRQAFDDVAAESSHHEWTVKAVRVLVLWRWNLSDENGEVRASGWCWTKAATTRAWTSAFKRLARMRRREKVTS